MMTFSKMCFPSVKDSTFMESCDVADLITTCSKDTEWLHLIFQCLFITVSLKPYYFVAVGGRNRKVVDAYARNGENLIILLGCFLAKRSRVKKERCVCWKHLMIILCWSNCYKELFLNNLSLQMFAEEVMNFVEPQGIWSRKCL